MIKLITVEWIELKHCKVVLSRPLHEAGNRLEMRNHGFLLSEYDKQFSRQGGRAMERCLFSPRLTPVLVFPRLAPLPVFPRFVPVPVFPRLTPVLFSPRLVPVPIFPALDTDACFPRLAPVPVSRCLVN